MASLRSSASWPEVGAVAGRLLLDGWMDDV